VLSLVSVPFLGELNTTRAGGVGVIVTDQAGIQVAPSSRLTRQKSVPQGSSPAGGW